MTKKFWKHYGKKYRMNRKIWKFLWVFWDFLKKNIAWTEKFETFWKNLRLFEKEYCINKKIWKTSKGVLSVFEKKYCVNKKFLDFLEKF